MSRRTIAILLIAFGLISIIGIGLWLWWPYRKTTVVKTPAPIAQQPPGYSNDQGAATTPIVNAPIAVPSYDRGQEALDERRIEDLLRRQAIDFTARAGTYANADEFAGLKQVYVDATPELQAYLEAQRLQLVKDHPVRGVAAWGQTARALSSKITSALPVRGASSVDVVVQLQVIAGPDGQTQKSYKQATLSYKLVNGIWVANRIVWADLKI